SFVHNVLRLNTDPVYFERAVTSDEPLTEGGRDKFIALTGERAQELLSELDTFLTRLAATERSDSGKRYGVGIYFFEDQADGAVEGEPRRPSESATPSPVHMQEID